MLIVVLLGITTLLVVYVHLAHRYWSRRGVAQEPPIPIVGNILNVILKKDHPGHVFSRIYKKYCGTHDAVGVYDFLTPKLLLINPELIKQVLISEFSSFHDNAICVNKRLDPYFYYDPFCLRGEAWKPARTSMVSLMTSNKVKEMFPYMKQLIPQLDAYINANLGKEIEVKELSSLFMMDNVSNSMFGLEANSFVNPEADFHKMGELFLGEMINSWWKIFISTYFPKVRDLFGYSIIPPEVSHYLENMMKKIVEYRKKNNVKRNDVIQQIMNKTGDNTFDMVVLGMAVFLDGFETSSSTISFTLYELAMNPQIQQILYEEIKSAMVDSDDIQYEKLINLEYLDKVIKETMRKYPVLYYMKKLCTKRCTLNIDGKPVEIEPNTPVVIPTYPIHRDPQFFPNPEVFDPERFANENSVQPCAYMPFGEGPRICPGMRFANAQMKLFLSKIAYTYKILRSESTPSRIIFSIGTLVMSSVEPLMLRLERRN